MQQQTKVSLPAPNLSLALGGLAYGLSPSASARTKADGKRDDANDATGLFPQNSPLPPPPPPPSSVVPIYAASHHTNGRTHPSRYKPHQLPPERMHSTDEPHIVESGALSSLRSAVHMREHEDKVLLRGQWRLPESLSRWERRVVLPCASVARAPEFRLLVLAVVVANTAVLGGWHYGMSTQLTRALQVANYVILALLSLELGVRWCGHAAAAPNKAPWAPFLRDRFNALDVVLTVGSCAEVACEALGYDSAATALRPCRVLRVFQLLRGVGFMRALMRAVLLSAQVGRWVSA